MSGKRRDFTFGLRRPACYDVDEVVARTKSLQSKPLRIASTVRRLASSFVVSAPNTSPEKDIVTQMQAQNTTGVAKQRNVCVKKKTNKHKQTNDQQEQEKRPTRTRKRNNKIVIKGMRAHALQTSRTRGDGQQTFAVGQKVKRFVQKR